MARFSKRLAGIAVLAFLVFGMYTVGGGFPGALHKSLQTGQAGTGTDANSSQTLAGGQKQQPGEIDPNAKVTDEEQKLVTDKIGDTPDLSEVYIDKTADGRLVVTATAALTQEENLAQKASSDKIIAAFIRNAYTIRPRIAGCMITVVYDNHVVAGASLGAAAQASLVTQTTAGVTSPAEVVAFLNDRNQQTDDITKNAWYFFAG